MSSPYRSDLADLQQRCAQLRHELHVAKNRTDQQKSHCAELEQQLGALEAELRSAERRRTLPMLQAVDVAKPCTVDWNGMVGDEVTRFCGLCKRSVYNLSAMTADEAEAFLQETFGSECIRFFRRADGTLMTRDCNVSTTRRTWTKVVAGSAALAVAATAIANAPAPTLLRSSLSRLTPPTHEPKPEVHEPPPTPEGHWMAGAPMPVDRGRR